jgi:hypothetical protein
MKSCWNQSGRPIVKINQIRFKNLLSYGNREQTVDLSDANGLHLIRGQNGAGKCLHGSTKIIVDMSEDMWKKFMEMKEEWEKHLR